MSVALSCGGCGRSFRVKDELAGKRIKCPGCREPVQVPQLQPAGAADGADDLDFGALAALEKKSSSVRKKITVTCGRCSAEFRADARYAGRAIECPECGRDVAVPKPVASSDGKDGPYIPPWLMKSPLDDSNQRRSRDQPLSAGWNWTRQGLNLVYWSAFALLAVTAVNLLTLYGLVPAIIRALVPDGGGIVSLLFAIASTVAALWLSAEREMPMSITLGALGYAFSITALAYGAPHGLLAVMAVVAIASLAVVLIGAITALLGACLCVTVPAESRVKPLAIAAAICLVAFAALYIVLLCQLAGGASELSRDPDRLLAHKVLSMGVLACAVAGQLLFVLFLRGIPKFFGDRPTREYINGFFIYQCIVTLANGIMQVIILGANDGLTVGVLVALMMILGTISLSWFVKSVAATRALVRPYFRT